LLKAPWIFVLVSVTWVFFRSPSLEVTRTVWQKLLFLDSAGLAWWFVPQCSRCPRWSWGDSSPGGGNGGSPSWRRGTRCSRPSWYSPSSCSSSPPWTARPSFTSVLKREGLAIGRVPPQRSSSCSIIRVTVTRLLLSAGTP